MTTEQHERSLMEAIRKADAHTNAASRLQSDAEDYPQIEAHYPDFWSDVKRFVIPLLEREAKEVGKEVARLREAS
jgi:hypothetical protein